jgi:hypothetical protein
MGDRPKKSWREIDAQRDRSGGSRPRESFADRIDKKQQMSSKQYRAALDALFEKGGLQKVVEQLQPPPPQSPAQAPMAQRSAPEPEAARPTKANEEKLALRKKLLEAIGRDVVSRAWNAYVKQCGMPEDFELLEQGLEHNKNDVIAETMTALELLLEREKPRRSKNLSAKLRFIEETIGNTELSASAARIRAKLPA